MTRRSLLMTPGLAAAAKARFQFAICNETFQKASFPDGCRMAKQSGYSGIEIAPFTLDEDATTFGPLKRRGMRGVMNVEGLTFAGLHAFLSSPKGLHLTGPDEAVRKRSWEYFRKFIDLCADLGDGGVMVLGSSKQREAVEGMTVSDATSRLADGLAGIAPYAESRKVTVLLEPLARHLCNVVNTLAQATAIVEQIGSPYVRTMFDSHNTANETTPADLLIERYFRHLHHVHLNEMDGKRPGAGSYDFLTVLKTLHKLDYRRWVSVEVFDFKPDGETVARESIQYLRALEGKL